MPESDLLSGYNPQSVPQSSATDTISPEYQSDLLGGYDPATGGAQKKETEPAPVWSEIPGQALSNAPHSAAEFAGNIAQSALHPIQTAENLVSIGLGVMEKVGRHIGLPSGQGYEKYADAVGEFMMNRYGSIDNIKRTLATDPVGVAADLSALFTGGGSLAAKLPGIAGRIGAGVSAAGSAVDPLNVITKPIGYGAGLAGSAAEHILGERLGAGHEAIGETARAGWRGGEEAREFRENLRQQTPVENVVNTSMDAVHNIVTNKNSNYKQGIRDAGLDKPISKSSYRIMDQGIFDAGDIGHLKGFVTNEGAIKANNDLRSIVDKFYEQTDIQTIEGLDGLKQRIGEYRDALPPNAGKAGVVASKYYDAVLDAIKNQAPKYAEVMEQYSEFKNLLKQLKSSLSLPTNVRQLNVETALRKMQSVMRNNVNTAYGFRKTLVDQLEANGAPNLRFALAGQALSNKSPRGFARIGIENGAELATGFFGMASGNPALIIPALKAFGISTATRSPRLMGEAIYYGARAASAAKALPYLGISKPGARVAQQMGRIENNEPISFWKPPEQARGGAIERALRITKRG